MLSSDVIIRDILTNAKNSGNSLLEPFHITYPTSKLAEESNSIFVACVSSENNIDGFEFNTFTDLVEILIVTKQKDYNKAITIIKTISNEICGLILKNRDKFPNKPVIRNINPMFNMDYILNRGQIMIQVNTEPVDFNITEDEYTICRSLLNEE